MLTFEVIIMSNAKSNINNKPAVNLKLNVQVVAAPLKTDLKKAVND